MLINPIYHFMRNNEYVEYAEAILDILRYHTEQHPQVNVLIDELEKTIEKHRYAMVGKTKNIYTEPLRLADQEREMAFVALRDYVKACNKRLYADWKKPTEHLLVAFRTYGWDLYTKDYDKQTHMMDLLLNELSENAENLEALSAIQAIDWFVELKAANEYFKSLVEDRTGLDKQKPRVKTSTTRLEVRKVCKKALALLSSDKFADAATLARVEAQANEAATKLNAGVKKRMEENKKRKGHQ